MVEPGAGQGAPRDPKRTGCKRRCWGDWLGMGWGALGVAREGDDDRGLIEHWQWQPQTGLV